MRGWIRSLVAITALGAVVLGLIAVNSSRPQAAASPTPVGTPLLGGARVEVGVIGDSLTVGSATAITNELTTLGLSARIDALNGRSIPGGITALRSMRADGFDSLIWVVALGTNDIFWNTDCSCGITTAAAITLIERMLDEIGPGRHVYWVNLNRTNVAPATQVFNEALARVATNRADLRIIDWYALSSANPSWFAADGVHFTSAAYARRGAQIATAVATSPVAQATQDLPSQIGSVGDERAHGPLAQRGDRGEHVRTLQQALVIRGLLAAGAVDGVFGVGTEDAVRAFQESIGLRPTGIVTAKTAAALGVVPA